MRFFWLTLVAVGLWPSIRVEADTIAYDNPASASGIQNFGHDLGLDFTVNMPIRVTELGAFDDGSTANLDGVAGGGIDVAIFNTNTGLQVGPSVHFSSTITGTQINGDAFLPANITLQDGNYSIVTYNDGNTNTNGGTNTQTITNDGGGLISFTGAGRYGSNTSLAFPGTPDGGPFDRYDAGTFEFVQAPESVPMGLLSLGIVGLGLVARRRWKR